MIVDTHVHVWEKESQVYPWSPIGNLQPNFFYPVEEQVRLMQAKGIDGGVIVQTSWYGFDNRYVMDVLQKYPDQFAGVGMVDPASETLADDLLLLVNAGISGLRLAPMLRPDIDWGRDKLWQLAEKYGLNLALLVDLPQALSFKEHIREYPKVDVVIDHMAHPEKETNPDRPDFKAFLDLSTFPNVFVKVSALGVMSQEAFPHRDMLLFSRKVIDSFSPKRCMWGTDHALSRKVIDIDRALQLLDRMVDHLTDSEADAVKGMTAARFWQIPPSENKLEQNNG